MSNTSATPGATPAGDLLDRWLAHREGVGPAVDTMDTVDTGAEAPAPAGTIGPDPVAEAPAPSSVAAPSAIDAGRAVLEALSHQRLEEAADKDPETRGVAAPAGPTTAAAATPAPALLATGHLGAAADAPSSGGRQRRGTSAGPRDLRPAPRPVPASAAANPVPPSLDRTRTKPATPIRRPAVAPPPGVELRSPTRARTALTVLSVLAAAGAVATAWGAWTAWTAGSDRTTTNLALAGGLGVLGLLLWSARGRRTRTVVTVENDVLRIVQGQTRHAFPLAGPYPPIDILGAPGDRGWKVLIQRRSMSPYVVTRSMVDPQSFTELIRHYRPNA